MTIQELINILQTFEDDTLEIAIKPQVGGACAIIDVEDWNNHALVIMGSEINTSCKECDGYGKLFSYRKEPNGGEPKSEPVTITEQCPKCEGKGYFGLQKHYEVNL
jgi:Zn finger protein HypA/HybF involved in hydrogenase expression